MKLRKVIAAVLLLASVTEGSAQEAVPTRIVIAPAVSPAAKLLKARLSEARDARSEAAQDLYFFYGGRGFEPVWLTSSEQIWTVNARTQALIALFKGAEALGLDPADYTVGAETVATIEDAVGYELALMSSALRFGLDNYGGRLDPRTISPNLDMPRLKPATTDLLQRLSEADDPAKLLADLAPSEPEFVRLLQLLTDAEDDGSEPVSIAEGPSIKPGTIDDRVNALRQRLGIPAVDGAELVYDAPLVEAVKSFQLSLALTSDGIVGNATRQALNRSGRITREQILINLEKWRWLPRERGDYRVEVNVPEFRLWIRRDGEVVHETRVVVGTPTNQTPIFYDQIRHVVVNPYWNVPVSIARNEIGPQVRRDPGYLSRREFELLNAGNLIDPWSVDWSSVAPGTFPFSIRQKPGAQNALGQVKFLFPNKHDVYLHDTPEKSLFSRDVRAYSHGCVRVENPFDFADALLANEPKFGRDTLVAAFGPRERWFNMDVKVPVYLTYFTLRVDEEGEVRSFADIYGHDEKIADALMAADQ